MSTLACILPRWRCRYKAIFGAPAALAGLLLLAACQGPPPPDEGTAGQSASALIRVADDARAAGDLGTAIRLYRRVHEMRPSDPKPLGRLGSTLAQSKSYTQAAQAYRTALGLAPHDADLRRGLAVVLLSLNQPEAAITELNAALSSRPDDPRILNALGVARDLMGRHDLAQESYLAGLRLDPQNNGLRNNYGLSLALAGDYGAAATTLGEVVEDPNASARSRLNLALVYGLAGDDKKASSIARTALDESSIRNNLAYYAMLRGMDDKARTAAIISGQVHGAPSDVPPPPKPRARVSTSVADKDPSPASGSAPEVTATAAAGPPPQDAPAPDAAQTEAAAAPTSEPPGEASGPPTKLTRPDAPEPQGDPAGGQSNSNSAPAAAADTSAAPAADAVPGAPGTPGGTDAAKAGEPTPAADAATQPAPPMPVGMPAGPAAATDAKLIPPSGFVVQFGAFSVEANAQKLADQLNGRGYKVSVVPQHDRNGRQLYAVRGETYPKAAEAEAEARRIHDAEKLPTTVVRQRPPGQA